MSTTLEDKCKKERIPHLGLVSTISILGLPIEVLDTISLIMPKIHTEVHSYVKLSYNIIIFTWI